METALTAALEQLLRLFRRLSAPSGRVSGAGGNGGLSLAAAATLATLERAGPCRLTDLATREAVTQPAMTQLVSRLRAEGLVSRDTDPSDGRVVQVRITDAGRAALANRREVRGERLAELLDQLSPADRETLRAAVPAMEALARLAEPAPDRAIPHSGTVHTGASW